jgi:hypothetical protein
MRAQRRFNGGSRGAPLALALLLAAAGLVACAAVLSAAGCVGRGFGGVKWIPLDRARRDASNGGGFIAIGCLWRWGWSVQVEAVFLKKKRVFCCVLLLVALLVFGCAFYGVLGVKWVPLDRARRDASNGGGFVAIGCLWSWGWSVQVEAGVLYLKNVVVLFLFLLVALLVFGCVYGVLGVWNWYHSKRFVKARRMVLFLSLLDACVGCNDGVGEVTSAIRGSIALFVLVDLFFDSKDG